MLGIGVCAQLIEIIEDDIGTVVDLTGAEVLPEVDGIRIAAPLGGGNLVVKFGQHLGIRRPSAQADDTHHGLATHGGR